MLAGGVGYSIRPERRFSMNTNGRETGRGDTPRLNGIAPVERAKRTHAKTAMKSMSNQSNEQRVPPRNCGLLARDLTYACHREWRKEDQWSLASYYGFDGEIARAEQAIKDRIHELESENKAQATVIEKLTKMAARLQTEVGQALEALRS